MLLGKSSKEILLLKTKYPYLYTVQLKLEHETRYIGKIDASGEGTFITYRKEEQLLKKTHSVGINYSLLADESLRFKHVIIMCNHSKLYSTREYFLSKGKPFKFSNKGYELQLSVPIAELNFQTVKKFEENNSIQENLFSKVS